eukprot:1147172-Rhodomonas_salina.2
MKIITKTRKPNTTATRVILQRRCLISASCMAPQESKARAYPASSARVIFRGLDSAMLRDSTRSLNIRSTCKRNKNKILLEFGLCSRNGREQASQGDGICLGKLTMKNMRLPKCKTRSNHAQSTTAQSRMDQPCRRKLF